MENGTRVGNKKPSMAIDKSVSTGKPSVTEDFTAHNPTGSRTIIGGQPVHGMPLMSAAAAKAK